jgi:hypothetical protein
MFMKLLLSALAVIAARRLARQRRRKIIRGARCITAAERVVGRIAASSVLRSAWQQQGASVHFAP